MMVTPAASQAAIAHEIDASLASAGGRSSAAVKRPVGSGGNGEPLISNVSCAARLSTLSIDG